MLVLHNQLHWDAAQLSCGMDLLSSRPLRNADGHSCGPPSQFLHYDPPGTYGSLHLCDPTSLSTRALPPSVALLHLQAPYGLFGVQSHCPPDSSGLSPGGPTLPRSWSEPLSLPPLRRPLPLGVRGPPRLSHRPGHLVVAGGQNAYKCSRTAGSLKKKRQPY